MIYLIVLEISEGKLEEINLSIRGFPSLFRKKNEKMERKKKEGLTALDTLLDATSISKYSFLKHQGNTKFQFNRATHALRWVHS